MSTYLDKFKSTVTVAQSNRLIKLLDQQKKEGQFKTMEEFKVRMNELMGELFSKRLKPLLDLFLAVEGQVIDTEAFNFMLDRIQDDLEIGFQEAVQIDEVQRGHQAVIDYRLRNLRHGLADLEAKVSTHELIVTSGYGFGSSLRSNFSGATNARLQRDSSFLGLFYDPRTRESLGSEDDCLIDQIGKYLVLPTDEFKYVNIVGARQIFDYEAPASIEDVAIEDISVENMIDNTEGTYWVYLNLYPRNLSTGERTIPASGEIISKIEIDLGGTQEINFVEIEPALLFPVILDSITYIRNDGTSSEFSGLNETIYNHRRKVQFRKIAATKLILEFKNETSSQVSYQVETADNTLSSILSQPVNERVGELALIVTKNFDGDQFQVGFDNIRVGLATYREKGIYLTAPLSLDNGPVKLFGLRSGELRPASATGNPLDAELTSSTYPTSSSDIFFGSVEFWVVRHSFDANDLLVATDTFPILPLGVTRISHERLPLTQKYNSSSSVNDSGTLVFFTNYTDGDIEVYRNGDTTPLTKVSELSVDDGWAEESNLVETVPNGGKPMKYGIRITQPRIGDIFTVSYNPITSNVKGYIAALDATTHRKIVDLLGDATARSYTDQLVLSSDRKGAVEVEKSQVHLMTVLRRNTADENLSPIVQDFLLAVGSKDPSKFEDLDE